MSRSRVCKKSGSRSGEPGIVVNAHLQTAIPHIYAAGDVKGGIQFTHVAGYEGRVVVCEYPISYEQRVDYRVVPWAIYTDPKLAHVGLTEPEATDPHGGSVSFDGCWLLLPF